MTPSAARPGAVAALRVMRSAAGRHALHVVLLAGGLFVLGLLCGGQAHAADATGAAVPTVPAVATPTEVVRSVTDPATRPVTDPATRPVTDPAPWPETKPATQSVTRSVAAVPNAVEHVVKPTAEQTADASVRSRQGQRQGRAPGNPGADVTDIVGGAVRPVGDLVETLTGGPAGPAADVLPSLPSMSPQTLPELPTPPLPTPSLSTPPLPTPPDLPGLPGLRDLPSLPGVDKPLPAPAAPSAPQQPDGTVGRGSAHGRTTPAPVPACVPTYGPHGWSAAAHDAAVRGGGDRARIVQVPAHRAPGGEPTGALGDQSAVDNGAPRHGDPQAVTLNHRAPLRLAPGAPAVVTAAETRDRHRDIPVFPG